MKILILVLSNMEPPYNELYEAQKRTWDSIDVEGVQTVYYWAGELNMLSWFLKLALDDVAKDEWDFIFRTNSSSYVDKQKILEFAEKLPKEKCYCGIDGDGFASGSGMFLSRDVVEILRNDLKQEASSVIEDVRVGMLLADHGIKVTPGAERPDYWYGQFLVEFYGDRGGILVGLKEAYHIRCKSDTEDRVKDTIAMEEIFRIKTENS